MGSSDSIDYSISDSVALIAMVAPNKRNTQSVSFVGELIEALVTTNNDSSVGAIVVTGQDGAFSAGGDMKELFLPKMRGEVPYDDSDDYLGGLGLYAIDWVQLVRNSKPIVVAFNGYAVGGGITSFLPADVLVASEQASFHFMFTKPGIVAEICSTKYLPARVGRIARVFFTRRTQRGGECLPGEAQTPFQVTTLLPRSAARITIRDRAIPSRYFSGIACKFWDRSFLVPAPFRSECP